ncbi:MAG: energy-coupling factor transporter transmembrane protein EcfT [Thaumarchaeota archaeon]|nr:energy-coupling factor transporter transmembrane protein EcfT [Nitrososphaerota archaeon]
MFWLAGGFIFRRVDSPFHRLDPRIKLLISLELFALAILSFSLVQLGTVIGVMFVISYVAKTLKRISRTMIFSAGFTAFIFIVNLIFTHSLRYSAIYSIRFIAIILSTSLFFITTSPDELEQVMKWFRFPRDIVFAFVTAVRFVPVLMLDALQIMDAQKSRGLEMDKGNVIKRVKNMVPVLVPLVVNSVIRSGELAEAMESRAYGAVPKPTSLYIYRSNAIDRAVGILSLFLFVIALYIYLNFPAPF